MKNIVLLVHHDHGQEARFQTALDLTRALDGHLICIDVTPFPVVASDGYAGMGAATLIYDERESEALNKAAVTRRLQQEDVSWDWQDATGDIATCVMERARMADLIVLNRRLDDCPTPDMRTIASRILMDARVPVVAVPETAKGFNTNGRALIAWDGQSSVIATVRACVPLLQRASEVHIFTVRDGSEGAEPTAAAAYLSRHDIHATVRAIGDGLHAADTLIAEETKLRRADYVVMGAYSHGRLREYFGGVTKRLLTHATVPLILGH